MLAVVAQRMQHSGLAPSHKISACQRVDRLCKVARNGLISGKIVAPGTPSRVYADRSPAVAHRCSAAPASDSLFKDYPNESNECTESMVARTGPILQAERQLHPGVTTCACVIQTKIVVSPESTAEASASA